MQKVDYPLAGLVRVRVLRAERNSIGHLFGASVLLSSVRVLTVRSAPA
jgi:hypothetical protein